MPNRFSKRMSGRPAVILDRDGTVIVERHYLSDPAAVELIPGAADGLRSLASLGMPLFLMTNQSGIGRGYFDSTQVGLVHDRIVELLRKEGVELAGVYVCPHIPEDHCDCRKPATGLIDAALGQHEFNPAASFVIGDKACDVEMGARLGAVTFLVLTGYGKQFAQDPRLHPDYIVRDLLEASQIIPELAKASRRA